MFRDRRLPPAEHVADVQDVGDVVVRAAERGWVQRVVGGVGASTITTCGRTRSSTTLTSPVRTSTGTAQSAAAAGVPSKPESRWPRSSTAVAPRWRAARRSSASRTAPRSESAVPGVASPASPRVAQSTVISAPSAAARASTDPQPKDSSSGCATTASHLSPGRTSCSRSRSSMSIPASRERPGAGQAGVPGSLLAAAASSNHLVPRVPCTPAAGISRASAPARARATASALPSPETTTQTSSAAPMAE